MDPDSMKMDPKDCSAKSCRQTDVRRQRSITSTTAFYLLPLLVVRYLPSRFEICSFSILLGCGFKKTFLGPTPDSRLSVRIFNFQYGNCQKVTFLDLSSKIEYNFFPGP
jgi:hypothetical protein